MSDYCSTAKESETCHTEQGYEADSEFTPDEHTKRKDTAGVVTSDNYPIFTYILNTQKTIARPSPPLFKYSWTCPWPCCKLQMSANKKLSVKAFVFWYIKVGLFRFVRVRNKCIQFIQIFFFNLNRIHMIP